MKREKTNKLVITFKSTTDAITMEKACKENNIPGRIVPVPRSISASCGLCWIVDEKDSELVLNAINRMGLSYEGRYKQMLV